MPLLAISLALTLPVQSQAQGARCQPSPPEALPRIQERVGWHEEWPEHIIADTINPANLLYRRIFSVQLREEATGRTLNDLLCKYSGVIIGGRKVGRGFYAIRVPDPGPDWKAIVALEQALRAEPGVEFAAPFTADGPPLRLN